MTRIKRGNVARKRRQKTLKLSSGFRGSSGTLFRVANQHALKAEKNAYRDRIRRKRLFRGVWITRINAAIRDEGLSYSQFINLTKQSKILLNRKIISQLAVFDKEAFNQLVFSVQ
ncbi:50S ribosomal protein L20 [bacterium]|nr:MAG: 50S ribosomal protein L20 [bacterium]